MQVRYRNASIYVYFEPVEGTSLSQPVVRIYGSGLKSLNDYHLPVCSSKEEGTSAALTYGKRLIDRDLGRSYAPTTISESCIIAFISALPLIAEIAVIRWKWLRRALVFPIEFATFILSVCVAVKVYHLLAREELETLVLEDPDRPDEYRPLSAKSGSIDWAALIPAVLIAFAINLFVQILASHGVAAAFQYDHLRDEDE